MGAAMDDGGTRTEGSVAGYGGVIAENKIETRIIRY